MKTAIIDGRISKSCRTSLECEGFRIIELAPFPALPAAICSHTDILFFAGEDEIIISEEYRKAYPEIIEEIKDTLGDIKISYSKERYGSEYPFDAIFNALVIGGRIFLREDSISRSVTEYARRRGLKIIPVRQGYPACTVLPLSDRCAITADRGMARALRENGIEVTLISDSEKIQLPPHSYGFIGGTSGIYGGCVYFLGNLEAHPDAQIIKGAIAEAGLRYKSLDGEADALFDLGGIRFYE